MFREQKKEVIEDKDINKKLFGVELAFVSESERNIQTKLSQVKHEFEWKYWSKKINNERKQILSQWKQKAKELHQLGYKTKQILKKKNSIKIIFEDEFWYQVDWDLTGSTGSVCEVTTKPLSAEEWQKREQQIQHTVFDLATEINLSIDNRTGGHIHLDVDNFDNDPLLFLNFFIDCQNHPELFLGVFGLRPNNPPLVTAVKNVRLAFQDILNDFEKQENQKWTIQDIAETIYQKVYQLNAKMQKTEARNNALNLENLLPESFETFKKNLFKTLEIRGLQAQKSARELILIINYFQARIEKLKLETTLLSFNNKHIKLTSLSKDKKHAENSNKISEDFENLIKDTPTLDWEDYKLFLKDLPKETLTSLFQNQSIFSSSNDSKQNQIEPIIKNDYENPKTENK